MSQEVSKIDIRVEEDAVVIVFTRKMDNYITPWQNAQQLGKVLEMAVRDIPNKTLIVDAQKLLQEQAQLKLNTYQDKYVALFFEWTDRLRFGRESGMAVARALQEVAQRLELLETKGIRLEAIQILASL